MSRTETPRAGRPRALESVSPSMESGSTRLGIYLRKLREGYGYTLRKVEEHAVSMGEAIDNSQLSRFEKGKAVPSFDKLRALARVFNVPVQSFSDVLDLEEYQDLKPDSDDHAGLLRSAADLMAKGKLTSRIDTHYPLSATAEALRYLETQRARGKVIIEIEEHADN